MINTTLTREDVIKTRHLSSRKAAKVLGVGKTTVNKYRGIYSGDTTELDTTNVKILIIDIESKPLNVYTWGLWNQNIGISQIVEHGGMICFAAKWLGESESTFYSEHTHGKPAMLQAAHDLLSEADIVVTYNGDRYDIKKLNNEFLLADMLPPRPFLSIDLFKTNKAQFDLPSRKLDYIVQRTNLGEKLKHTGFQLWLDCMAGDDEAWKMMEEYNREDVNITERLYIKLLPWLKGVPHYGMFSGAGTSCPYCGSEDITSKGETTTKVQRYPLYSCDNCGGWSRGNKPLATPLATRVVR